MVKHSLIFYGNDSLGILDSVGTKKEIKRSNYLLYIVTN